MLLLFSFPLICLSLVLSFIDSYLKNLKNDPLKLKELANLINVKTENVFLFSKNIFLSSDFLRNSPLDGELDINLIRNSKHQLVNGNLKAKIAADQRQTVEVGFAQTGLSNLVDKFINEITKRSTNLQAALQELLNQFISLKKDKEGIETLMNRLVREEMPENEPTRFMAYLNMNRKTIFLIDFNNESNDQKPLAKSKRSIHLKSFLSQAYERAFVIVYLNIGKELSNPLSPIKFELAGVAVFGLKLNNRTLAPTLLNEISTSIEIGTKQEHKLMLQSTFNLSPVFSYHIRQLENYHVLELTMKNNTIPLVRSMTYFGEQSAQAKLISEAAGRPVCTARLTKLIGIEFCLSESRNLEKPIQKLVLYEIYLKKTDLSFKKWQIVFTLNKSRDSNNQLNNIVILFDTPGSALNRKFNSNIQLRRSPKNLSLNGSFSSELQNYGARLNINMSEINYFDSTFHFYSNGRLTLTMDYDHQIKHLEGGSEYIPTLRIVLGPDLKPFVYLEGIFAIDLVNKNNLKLILKSKINNHLYLNSTIIRSEREKTNYQADIVLSLPDLINANLTSLISTNQQLSTNTTIVYVLVKNNAKDTIKLATSFKKTSYNTMTEISTSVGVRCAKQSNFNFDLTYNLTYEPNMLLKNDFKFKYLNIKELNLIQRYALTKPDPKSESFSCEHFLRVNMQPQQLTYQSQVDIVYHPAPDLFQYKLDFNFDKISSQLQFDIAKFNFDYQQISKKPLKSHLKTGLLYKNQFDASYRDELEEVAKNEFKGETMVKWSKNKFVQLRYDYVIRNNIVGKYYKVNSHFLMHHFPHPYTHQALFEYQKNNFTVKSLFKIKDNQLWNFNLFHEYHKLFNLSLESEYLNIRNQIKLQPGILGTLLIDANKFIYFDHSTFFNYTNQNLFGLSSLTTSKKNVEKTNIKLIDRLNEKLRNKLLANLTVNRHPGQLKLNLLSSLVSSVKLNYNDQTYTGQFEVVDREFQQKSSWTWNNELHVKMKLTKQGQSVGNLVFLTETDYNSWDLKSSYYAWTLNANLKFKVEGRKVVILKLNKLGSNGQLLVDHTTNISVAVTNGYIKSETFRNSIKNIDFDASIQGRHSSKVALFVKDLFQFNLLFNPFIKNKFADLEINDISEQEPTESRKYLAARFEYDPRSFALTTNYFNEKLTYQRTREQSMIKMDFKNLKFFGESSHLLIQHKNFTQYNLKMFGEQANHQSNSTPALKALKEIDLKFVSKREFYLLLEYENGFVKSDVDLNSGLFYLNLLKQPYQIEFKVVSNNVLLIDYNDKQTKKQLKLFVESNNEYLLLNYAQRRLLESYDHETKIYLFNNYDLDARLETVNRYLFKVRYNLWQKFELTYRKPDKEVQLNLIKDRIYLVQISEKSELYKLEFKEEDRKIVTLLARSVEFVHQSELTYGDPERVDLFKLVSTHSRLSGSREEKALDLSLLVSKAKESQLLVVHYEHSLSVKIDPFAQKNIQAIYRNEQSNLLSSTEFAYLGPQTYHLYSNVTENNEMPFQFALIAVKKKPTLINLIKDDWRLAGEFNFLKLSKQTGVIRIRNDAQKLYGNITLEANRKSFLIANYILKDSLDNIKGQANLTMGTTSSEILKFDYKDEGRRILTQLFWLRGRMMLNSEVNHTDYTHKIVGLLKHDLTKTVKLSLNKTYNADTTLQSDLIASLTRTSHLYVEQISFGNLNVSVDLIDKQQQKIDLIYLNADQSAVFHYTKQNETIDSNLATNLQKFHPLLLFNSSFNLMDGQLTRPSSGKLMKSSLNLNLLEPEYNTKIISEFDFDEDSITFNLITQSPAKLLPTTSSNISLSGLSSKYYLLNSNLHVNKHRLTSIYRHREYLNLEYSEERLGYYQAKYVRKSNADEPLSAESFVKRMVDGKTTVLDFSLSKSKNDLNSAFGLEHLNRKTTFAFTKLDDQVAQKRTLIFESIFDSQVYDLRFVRINNDLLKKRTVTLNSPYLSRPLLVDFEKKKNDLLLKWNLLENQSDNRLKIDFKGLQLTEMYKLVKTIVSYNDKEIVGLDLEKNPHKSDLTRLNVNFFNSTVKLEDNHERLIFNLNDKDLTLKVDKEYRIHLESQLRADKLSEKINQRIVLYYDVQKKAVSYQDFELESLRTLSTQLLVKLPVPLASTYISILNTKDEINNEIFLLQINTTDLNKRKFVLKHNGIYLFSVRTLSFRIILKPLNIIY